MNIIQFQRKRQLLLLLIPFIVASIITFFLINESFANSPKVKHVGFDQPNMIGLGCDEKYVYWLASNGVLYKKTPFDANQ